MGCVRVSSKVSCVLAINYLCVWGGGGGEGRSGIVLRVGQTTEEKKNFMVLRVIRDTLLSVPSLSPPPFKASATTATHFALSFALSTHPPFYRRTRPMHPFFLTREQITKESF